MKKAFSLILCALLLLPGGLLCRAADAAQAGADDVLRFYQQSADVTNTQALIDGVWGDSAGHGSESLVLAAKQYQPELDLTRYAANLKQYVAANTVDSATTREMLALMFVLCGVPEPYITQTLNEAPGKLGVMSWVYALHLLNNGYTSTVTTQKKAQKQLLDLQLSDGGWAISGSVSDVDVTAMVLSALAPAYQQDGAVTAAVDGAVRLLSERQNADGTLSSYGVKNPESISQTIIALSALGIDAARDGRFVKNGVTLFDALGAFRLADGSYCHERGGAGNRIATAQAFSAYVAAYRQAHSLGSLYYVPPAQRPTVTQPTAAPATQPGSSTSARQSTKPAAAEPESKTSTTAPPKEASTTAASSSAAATTQPTAQSATQSAAQSATQPPQASSPAAAPPAAQPAAPAQVLPQQAPVQAGTTGFARSAFPASGAEQPSEMSLVSAEEAAEESTEEAQANESASTAAAEAAAARQTQPSAKKKNIKWILLIAVWVLAAALCTALYLFGKRNKSWFIAVLLAAVLLTAGTLATSIQRKEEFFSVPETASNAETMTVSLAIRCDSVVPYAAENPAIPADGVILESSAIALAPGSTAYDQLLLAARQNGFTFINKAAADNDYKDAYISTLAGLSEFDYGDNSGWLFTVNGQLAPVGCGACQLHNGDRVVWYYTCNYVEDMTKDFSAF